MAHDGCGEHADRRASGALEAEVMAVLWGAGEPMTAGTVRAALAPGLAYKTVLTVLGRLHAKGLLDRERVGRAHAYHPRHDAARVSAAQMKTMLDRGRDRTAVLQHFVEALDPADEAALRSLLGLGG
ncbi:BlaI/MecI/CopY family transcriptional regulator [Streptomyces broussonetiae]|uniref:BlaI/MecI/CopY family transcriptional regulator n=1 Tax=Streptomyces broussonetiae TaxID=2686304 RepID=A0A6I6MU47_9ACTN|nr:BlaI/MecI/CopY family transcriptional regulator [Streptomyces broussonetiae]QHA02544.1 BlaI/MecI/CopY family transcriptional regulator [Streptomyces broussonetiae]